MIWRVLVSKTLFNKKILNDEINKSKSDAEVK